MPFTVPPVKKVYGVLSFSGDKSVAHRAIILSAISNGKTIIRNFPHNIDCLATLKAFQELGIKVKLRKGSVVIVGKGLYGLRKPKNCIYAYSSGTTLRLLLGVLSAQNFNSELKADSALSKRQMLRIAYPLRLMGADIRARKIGREEFSPLMVFGKPLRAITYFLPIASAQVKSGILLAGLFAKGRTCVAEKIKTRDHTERMLKYFGAKIVVKGKKIFLEGQNPLISPKIIYIPGDISSASFFIVAALLLKGSRLKIKDVSINPSRSLILKILQRMNARIQIKPHSLKDCEPRADITARFSKLKGIVVKDSETPGIIDEIPVLMVAACLSKGKTLIKGVNELRVKETDRINSMTVNLRKMGADIKVVCRGKKEDILINGIPSLKGAFLNSYHDHRTAMSLIIASFRAQGKTQIDEIDCIDKSFPSFLDCLFRVKR